MKDTVKNSKKGFTLAELLIVVAIIGVLVAVAVPLFSSQLEKSREAVDLANVRNAYAEVMSAAMVEDTSSPLYRNGRYQIIVPLKQTRNGWNGMDPDKLVVGGISHNDSHWVKKDPRAKGRCKVYYTNGEIFLNWAGEDHINMESAGDFLTQEILQVIVGNDYPYSVINSNETYGQGGGTKKFIDYAKANGFDLEDYGAKTWQIYAKESDSADKILTKPAIYWSSLDLEENMIGKNIPVMGYRDGKYDVYFAEVVKYNGGKKTEYLSIKNNFANVTNAGGSASFQFNKYEDAKAAYDKIMAIYEDKKTLEKEDMTQNGL